MKILKLVINYKMYKKWYYNIYYYKKPILVDFIL